MFSSDSATLGLTSTERVHIGRRAADAIAEEASVLQAQRVFLLVSATMRATTNEIALIEAALGDRLAATFGGIGPFVNLNVANCAPSLIVCVATASAI